MPERRFFLISRVGRDSLHSEWLAPAAERGFDLLLSAFDDAVAPVEGDGVLFERRPGRKVAGYGALLEAHRDRIARYEYVALFDDDLAADARAITRLFEIAAEHRLAIAQPALTHDSWFSYAALLRHPGFLLRWVSYVEMMCPIFRSDVLLRLIPLYQSGYESGIDLIWSSLIRSGARDFAVIDAEPVRHTRPIGKLKAANGFEDGRRYESDIHAILARYGADWLPCVPSGGIRADGRTFEGRLPIWPAALGLVGAVPLRTPVRIRARNLAVYWKHLLTAA